MSISARMVMSPARRAGPCSRPGTLVGQGRGNLPSNGKLRAISQGSLDITGAVALHGTIIGSSVSLESSTIYHCDYRGWLRRLAEPGGGPRHRIGLPGAQEGSAILRQVHDDEMSSACPPGRFAGAA